MRIKHISGPSCPSCDLKLQDAHPVLKEWFLKKVKPNYPDCHVSWSYRSEEEQNNFKDAGKSMLKWPSSPHNFTHAGQKMALALDLFQIIEPAMTATWSMSYFEAIYQQCAIKHPETIAWSGGWKSKKLVEYCHFELKKYKEIMAGKIDPDTIVFL